MGIGEDGFQDLGHDLANAALYLADEVGPFQGDGEPEVLVVEELVELLETGVDRPQLSLCWSQDVSWNHFIRIQNKLPWLGDG